VTDLRHHGDVDAEPGLQDFAVNVRGTAPPAWLRDRLVQAVDRLGTYPSAADDARARASSPPGTAATPARCWY
jgi:histidinol-phosphate aminotransferase